MPLKTRTSSIAFTKYQKRTNKTAEKSMAILCEQVIELPRDEGKFFLAFYMNRDIIFFPYQEFQLIIIPI